MEAIWAEDKRQVIGQKGKLPWHLPYDLHFFKQMTMNKTMIMGRKTFDAMGRKALPQRKSIVLTTQVLEIVDENIVICHSFDELLTYMNTHDENYIVIGGHIIFDALLPYCQTLYVTKIDACYQGDTFSPSIPSSFQCTKQRFVPKEVTKSVDLCIETYQKN